VIATNVLLIYFLVAAIIESYNQVSQNLGNQIYLARAKILFENSLLFQRDHKFANTRYVIKAQAERSTENAGGNSDWDAVTAVIGAQVKNTVEQEAAKTETSFKFLKNKVVKLSAAQENQQQQVE
jgi:hypothetical protein